MATEPGSAAPFEEQMEREHAAFLERARTGDLRTVVAALREWSEVESVPAQDEFDVILARLEALTNAYPRPKATPGYV